MRFPHGFFGMNFLFAGRGDCVGHQIGKPHRQEFCSGIAVQCRCRLIDVQEMQRFRVKNPHGLRAILEKRIEFPFGCAPVRMNGGGYPGFRFHPDLTTTGSACNAHERQFHSTPPEKRAPLEPAFNFMPKKVDFHLCYNLTRDNPAPAPIEIVSLSVPEREMMDGQL